MITDPTPWVSVLRGQAHYVHAVISFLTRVKHTAYGGAKVAESIVLLACSACRSRLLRAA